MQLTDRVYLVGSGSSGFGMTFHSDCHIYLIDGGSELALVDAGTGPGQSEILENIISHGFAPEDIHYLFLTHLHTDHAGGAAGWRALIPHLHVLAAKDVADVLRQGDEQAIHLDMGKAAGYYEADLQFAGCPVDVELVDGNIIRVGELEIETLETPGHCVGHLCFVMRHQERTFLFSGDNLFYGGRILLQPIPDCVLWDHLQSLKKLAGLDVDVLLPGHGAIALKEGQNHVSAALSWIERCLIPPSFV